MLSSVPVPTFVSLCSAGNHGKLSMNYATDFKSIRGQVSAEEWQARVDLKSVA